MNMKAKTNTQEETNIIRLVRQALGITQAALARRLDVHVITMNRWEKGHQRPSHTLQKKIRRLARRYGVPLPD